MKHTHLWLAIAAPAATVTTFAGKGTKGFSGWIGGVAVFDRALSAEELGKLSAIRSAMPIANLGR